MNTKTIYKFFIFSSFTALKNFNRSYGYAENFKIVKQKNILNSY